MLPWVDTLRLKISIIIDMLSKDPMHSNEIYKLGLSCAKLRANLNLLGFDYILVYFA